MLSAIKQFADEYELQQSKCKSTVAEQTPPQKKQRCNADNTSVLENTSSYNMLSKVFDLSLTTHDLKKVQEITNILVTELNTLHQALDSNMHLEIVVNNDPISIVIPISGSKESSNTSEENEVRYIFSLLISYEYVSYFIHSFSYLKNKNSRPEKRGDTKR